MTHLDRDIGIVSGNDGIDEFAMMTHLCLKGNIGIFHLHVEFRIGGCKMAATDLDPTVVAKDLNTLPLPVERLLGDNYSVVIFICKAVIIALSLRDNLDRAAPVFSDCPLGNVEHMGSPVSHKATTGHLIPAPGTPELLTLIGGNHWIE